MTQTVPDHQLNETTVNSVSRATVAMREHGGAWGEFVALRDDEVDLAVDELRRVTTPAPAETAEAVGDCGHHARRQANRLRAGR